MAALSAARAFGRPCRIVPIAARLTRRNAARTAWARTVAAGFASQLRLSFWSPWFAGGLLAS